MKTSLRSILAISILLATLGSSTHVRAEDSTTPAAPVVKKLSKKKNKKAKQANAGQASTATPVATPAATAPAAQATDSTPASNAEFSQGAKNIKASLLEIFEGGRLDALDGVKKDTVNGVASDAGSALQLRHEPTIGYKFHPNYTVSLGEDFVTPIGSNPNTFDDNPSSKPKQKFTAYTDPYLTVSAGNLMPKTSRVALPSYIRYYIPAFLGPRSRGTQNDVAHGAIRLQTVPTMTVAHELIELSMLTRFVYRLAGISQDYATRTSTSYYKAGKEANPNTPRRNWKYMLAPQIAVNVTPKFQPYFYWTTNYIEHNTEGKFTALNDPNGAAGLGHGIEIGFNYNFTTKFFINPYVDFGGGLESRVNADGTPDNKYNLSRGMYALLAGYTFK